MVRDFKGSELVFFRAEVGCGFHRLVPGYFLAAVAGFAAEDAGHGAFGDVLGFVEGLPSRMLAIRSACSSSYGVRLFCL